MASKKYFPKEINEIVRFIFKNQFGIKDIKSVHTRFVREKWTKRFPDWNNKWILDVFIESSDPDVYYLMIQFCRDALLAHPPKELQDLAKRASLTLSSFAFKLRQKDAT